MTFSAFLFGRVAAPIRRTVGLSLTCSFPLSAKPTVMTRSFLDCTAPLRRARLHTLGCPRTSRREPIQFFDVRDPAGLRNNAVLQLHVIDNRPSTTLAHKVRRMVDFTPSTDPKKIPTVDVPAHVVPAARARRREHRFSCLNISNCKLHDRLRRLFDASVHPPIQ
ncbi:hypothetical protein [Burkholderia stagnalis]|uniref:hypothetical protein n=1 Tax=Burkholderia stagnalis TaxID=1503054 RepID=UPI0012DA64BE|nr:hypothetical protein [Burkholderia stagnalis]